MGILQNYINNGSEYKSLKFGKDKPEGGSSKQPFMQKDINTAEPIAPGLLEYPSVLRGGIYAEALAATDVARLTKYFATPSGIQFAVNQNILSRLAPRTEASGVLNEYIYTPLSTLAQAGVGNLGIHLNKQGLDPTGLTDYAIKPYGEVVSKLPSDENRLIKLTKDHIGTTYVKGNLNSVLRNYTGGPGSIFGVGNTKINFATNANGDVERTMGSNLNNPKTYLTPVAASVTYDDPSLLRYVNKWKIGLSIYDPNYQGEIESLSKASFSSPILNLLPSSSRQLLIDPIWDINRGTFSAVSLQAPNSPLGTYSSYNTLHVDAKASAATPSEKAFILNEGNDKGEKGYLANLDKSAGYTQLPNGDLIYDANFLEGIARGVGPDYRKVNRKVRGFNDPKNTYDYITKTPDDVVNDGDYFLREDKPSNRVLDKIYYTSDNKRTSTDPLQFNDIIPFRISIVDQSSPNYTSTQDMQFRAYIDNMSDSYDADWSAQTYMGRGEKLYKYNSFGRSISLGFTVVAEGHAGLSSMYAALNTLASSLAPTYINGEYMSGNIHKLTLGNYVKDLYGIITGFTYDIDSESPWEIGGKVNIGDDSYDNKQLPMFIKVTGFKFTPIHDFRPEYNDGKQFINMGKPELPLLGDNSERVAYEPITPSKKNNPAINQKPPTPSITSLAGNTEPSNPVIFK